MSIPNNIRVPMFAVEFDNSQAEQGPSQLAYRALLAGQKIAGNSAAANSLHRVTSADAVATLCGRGSMLHLMAVKWFQVNKFTETWILVLADNPAGVVSTGTFTVAGSATATGTLYLYIGGKLVEVAVSSGASSSAIAAAIAATLGSHASGTVTFSAADAADNVTIGATTFVGTTGVVIPGAATYSVDTGNTEAAASLASQVNAHVVASQVVHATSSGAVCTLRARKGGTAQNSVVLTSTDAVDLAVSGAGTLTGGTAETDLPVHASVSGSVVTVHFNHQGDVGDELDLRYNYQAEEELPAGVTLTVGDMANGTSNPSLTAAIAALGDTWFNVIANPYTDSTSLSALETELADRFGPSRMIDGVAIAAKDDTVGNLGTLGDSRNSPHSVIVEATAEPMPSYEKAAQVAAQVALEGSANPSRPFHTLPLPGLLAPAETDKLTQAERNTLLYDGISTTKADFSGNVVIERLITTYKTNAAGASDTSYLRLETMLTLMYLRYTLRQRFLTKFPRHKLGDDTVRPAPGQPILTPKIAKAECVAWFQQMQELGHVRNLDQFKEDLVVQVSSTDPDRLEFLVPPTLMGQFVVGAAALQFRL